jgi:3-methyladenine DNA glycosylase AlkD
MTTLTSSRILSRLRSLGSAKNRAGMARYGITSKKVFGVGMKPITALRRRIGRDHDLALKLWKSGWLEARVLAIFIADPEKVDPPRMNAWARDFDNWAITDGACLHLFADTKYGPAMALRWVKRKEEFVKRAGFVIMAVRAVHDKSAPDAAFLPYLRIIEREATDKRNGVKKGVNWALRQVGKRSPELHAAALNLAERLAASKDPAARWVGSDAARELKNAKTISRIQQRARRQRSA